MSQEEIETELVRRLTDDWLVFQSLKRLTGKEWWRMCILDLPIPSKN